MKPTARVQEIGAYKAKTNLSRLLRQTRAGKSFIITQRGKPVAELKPAPIKRGKSRWGDMKGKILDFEGSIEDFAADLETKHGVTLLPIAPADLDRLKALPPLPPRPL